MPERSWFESEETYNRVAALEHRLQQVITLLGLAPALATLEVIEENARKGIREIPIRFSEPAPMKPIPVPQKAPAPEKKVNRVRDRHRKS
jgi:hypothetical protein